MVLLIMNAEVKAMFCVCSYLLELLKRTRKFLISLVIMRLLNVVKSSNDENIIYMKEN